MEREKGWIRKGASMKEKNTADGGEKVGRRQDGRKGRQEEVKGTYE